MSTITLTPARAAVLNAVRAGEVTHYRNWGKDPDEDVWRPGGYGHKRVNAAIEYLRAAGLVKLGRASSPSMYASKPWELTETGEQWLAKNEVP